MNKKDVTEEKKIQEQIQLLLTDPKGWSDEQIEALLANSKNIENVLYRLYHSFPLRVERIRRYRARKKEISVLSTEKLLEMQKSINASRSVAIAEDDYDEQPDSLYEPPPIDSDEYIISEILKERKTAK